MDQLPQQVPIRDYLKIADSLKCSPVIVRALSIQESGENPNAIRFEKHKWKRYRLNSHETKRFDKTGNPRKMDDRWSNFEKMHKQCLQDGWLTEVAKYAAVKAHSFGWCQIMGFNHRHCGYENPLHWHEQMQTLEGQRACFVAFVRGSSALLAAFRAADYDTIAHHYNGPAFKRNKYNKKLISHVEKLGGIHAEFA